MSQTAARPAPPRPSDLTKPADVFVVFGITGDLAKVMTFRSLYRLERRGLLDCPIVGVAVDDWTREQLLERARTSIVGTGEELDETVFERFAKRLSYVQGDFGDAATYERVGAAINGAATPVFYLEIPPFLFGRVVKGLADAGLTTSARVVVEKPFGSDTASARALAEELHQYIDESQLLRIDHYLGKMGLEEIIYLRFANAILEPVWNRNFIASRADHDGRGLRRGGSRALLRSRSAPSATSSSTTSCRWSPWQSWRRPREAIPRRSRPRSSPPFARSPRPIPRTTCAASTTAIAPSTAWPPTPRPRPTAPSGSRSRTGAGRACRSSSARASACRSRRPSCGSSSGSRHASASPTSTATPSPTRS